MSSFFEQWGPLENIKPTDVLLSTLFGEKLKEKLTLEEAVDLLKSMNLVNVGELAEQAISKKSGVKMCDRNTPEIDLVSGKQIKHATTSPVKNKPNQRKAFLSIAGTTAPILAVITETITNEQYFLYIPFSAYRHLSGNTISLYFDKDGNPGTSQWWNYEVNSFEELCDLAK